jgi:hypothetical protein
VFFILWTEFVYLFFCLSLYLAYVSFDDCENNTTWCNYSFRNDIVFRRSYLVLSVYYYKKIYGPLLVAISHRWLYTFFMESVIWKQEVFDYSHVPGRAVLHRGRHRHGARATTSGQRINLLMWCRRWFHLLVAYLHCYLSLFNIFISFIN